MRVCSSRNSMADSLTGTAYFKKTSGGTSVKQEAVESSRAIKGRLPNKFSEGEFLEEENGVSA